VSGRAWAARAACQGQDPALWFPEDHKGPSPATVAEALTICSACPVRAQCLDDALATEGGRRPASRYGIRGGLTGGQRHEEYRRRTRRATRKAAIQ
jgi:WhiB family redox-sensing transcriptional regulator